MRHQTICVFGDNDGCPESVLSQTNEPDHFLDPILGVDRIKGQMNPAPFPFHQVSLLQHLWLENVANHTTGCGVVRHDQIRTIDFH